MRSNGKGAGFGIFLLTVGIIWLLSMAKIVTWSTLNALCTLWPLILVAVGVGFIFRSSRVIRTITWLALLAVIIGYGYYFPSDQPLIKYDLHFGDDQSSKVMIEKKPLTEKGELTLDYSAMQVNIGAAESGLLDTNVNDALVDHTEEWKDDDRTASIKFKMKENRVINLASLNNLRNDFHLGRDVIWSLKLKTGATTGNLNLSGLKVDKLDIDTGFTTLRLDMGSYNTVMNIGSGVSKIDITLPGDTGMKIRIGGLNSSNLEKAGWKKKGDWYYSPDYDKKEYKIDAEVKNGVGSLKVENR